MEDVNIRRSEKMKENFREGKIKGWSINTDKNRRSYPEKFFIEVMKNNGLFERFQIEEKFSYGKYFIDFLFIDLKLVVEIDGEQHFRDEKSIEHDITRDNYFISEGFKVYRIRWKNLFNNTKSEINEFLTFLNDISNQNYRKYSIENCTYQTKKKRKYKPRVRNKICLDCENLIHPENVRCRKCYLEYRKNNSKEITKVKELKNVCIDCSMRISGKKLCKSCYNKKQRTVERPDTDTLKEDIKNLGFSGTGRKYGVSDNSIRKWIKNK